MSEITPLRIPTTSRTAPVSLPISTISSNEDRSSTGFRGVEFQVPYQWPVADLASLLCEHRLELALIDTPQGNWDAWERGLAALPGREEEFRAGVEIAADYAQ